MDKTTTELIKQIKDERKLKFLELYPQCKCRITSTAKAIGLSKQTIHTWLNTDGNFLDAFDSVKKQAEKEIAEKHIANVRSIAFDPEVPPQTRLLGSFFELKALDNRYRDKVVSNTFTGNIVIESTIPRPALPEGEVIDSEAEEVT